MAYEEQLANLYLELLVMQKDFEQLIYYATLALSGYNT